MREFLVTMRHLLEFSKTKFYKKILYQSKNENFSSDDKIFLWKSFNNKKRKKKILLRI